MLDEDANGSANEVYFPNPHMPVREDLFKKVTEQIRNRTTVKKNLCLVTHVGLGTAKATTGQIM
ncbi:hypothetical protein EKL28_16555 [Staphylococcus aureus]|nr:hypothetical protein EKL28_16555 [Staphylococcus aureus]